MKNGLHRYRVYYFVGDFYSSQGEKRRVAVIEANDETEAEDIFKTAYPDVSFGWVEPIHSSRK